jgi:hypothetical protein
MLVNHYTPGVELTNFPEIYSKLTDYYDLLFDTVPSLEYQRSTARWKLELGAKIGFKDIFYYIDKLYDNRPSTVVDVGCGENLWKKWFPNIIGFDPTPSQHSQYDFIDYFDSEFSSGHTAWYDCGMALNSVHFVDWADIPQQLDLAMNIVKDRFLFTYNFQVIPNKPSEDVVELSDRFTKFLTSSSYKIVLLDYPRLRFRDDDQDESKWAHVNGHVRFILAHRNKENS